MKANHRTRGLHVSHRLLGVVAIGLLALAGCAQQTMRSQAEDEGGQLPYSVETIKQWASFDGVDPMPVYGVGLVTGLAGTGGGAPPGDERKALERELGRMEGVNAKEVLARRDVSMVRVTALIPPGAQMSDPIDLKITLPPGSKTTSLEGGYLMACDLRNYAPENIVAPNLSQGNTASLPGHIWARAEGRVVVGLGVGDDSARVKEGFVWGGGKCKAPRPLYVIMNESRQQAKNTSLLADRINDAFRSSLGGPLGDKVAEAKNGAVIVLNIPPQYRLNLPHYMRVVGLIPLRDNETRISKKADAGRSYFKRLENEVLDPAFAVTASLRLEALGDTGKTALRHGMRSDSLLVRFCCAECLAYENEPQAAPELAKLVDEPALRAFCLTALASLDEATSYQSLTELLSSPVPEIRYGAFRALRVQNKDADQEAIPGELLNDAFWLHKAAPNSRSMIHVSSSHRAEIVLFGEEAYFKAPLRLSAGEINVTADDGDSQCTVSRFSPRTREKRSNYSSLKVEDVIRRVADMGGDYAAITELLRQAKKCEDLSCSLEVDALPQATSVYALKRAGQRSKGRSDGLAGTEDDEEVLSSKLDLGATPTLFEKDNDGKRLHASDTTTPAGR
jgi:hypothetical protein